MFLGRNLMNPRSWQSCCQLVDGSLVCRHRTNTAMLHNTVRLSHTQSIHCNSKAATAFLGRNLMNPRSWQSCCQPVDGSLVCRHRTFKNDYTIHTKNFMDSLPVQKLAGMFILFGQRFKCEQTHHCDSICCGANIRKLK